ncbi:unnamed protein product, partial [Phaeothamnion confervicola]
LIGFPRFFPRLHVAVVCLFPLNERDDGKTLALPGKRLPSSSICVQFDFIPLDPTSPSTIERVLTLQGVPGEIRERRLEFFPLHATF